MSTENEVIAYKAFDADMSCRGFKFEVGKTYEQEGPAVICERGFHACLLPFDCFNYYRDSKTWARVRMVSPSEITPDGDTKLVTAKITIEATLSVSDWVRAQCAALLKLVKGSNTAKATTGDYAHSATTGDYAHSATTGYSAHSATTGYSAHSATTGHYAHSATTGYYAHSATTGNYARSATTGDYARSATAGNSAHSATTGDYARSATTGDYAHSATTGDSAHSATAGNSAIACSLGIAGRAKAAKGSWMVLAEYDADYKVKTVKTFKAGTKGVKADTWYELKNGKLKAVKE